MDTISYKGFNVKVLTFDAEGEVKNKPVVMDSNGLLKPASINDNFIGICTSLRERCAGVQMQGYIELPYSDEKPSFGYCKLTADGNGGVKTTSSETANYYRVIKIDDKTVGFIL